jgi:hypothetical protein
VSDASLTNTESTFVGPRQTVDSEIPAARTSAARTKTNPPQHNAAASRSSSAGPTISARGSRTADSSFNTSTMLANYDTPIGLSAPTLSELVVVVPQQSASIKLP